jgi:hypothetical protein
LLVKAELTTVRCVHKFCMQPATDKTPPYYLQVEGAVTERLKKSKVRLRRRRYLYVLKLEVRKLVVKFLV